MTPVGLCCPGAPGGQTSGAQAGACCPARLHCWFLGTWSPSTFPVQPPDRAGADTPSAGFPAQSWSLSSQGCSASKRCCGEPSQAKHRGWPLTGSQSSWLIPGLLYRAWKSRKPSGGHHEGPRWLLLGRLLLSPSSVAPGSHSLPLSEIPGPRALESALLPPCPGW